MERQAPKINVLKLIISFLQNFPSIVLDTRDLSVPAGGEIEKKGFFHTYAGDFEVRIKMKNRTTTDKKFKSIVFITDL